jgi:antitoxin ParD1/3/4
MAVFANGFINKPSTPMSTATMNVLLPNSLKEYVRGRLNKEERYSTPSDYVRSLIREDQKKRDKKHLEQMLLEGARSGRGVEIGSKEWDTFWERIHARLQERKQKHIYEKGFPRV